MSTKRFASALIGLFALGWTGIALAQANSITTSCPTNFTCAFSAAEAMSLVTPNPNKPGQPDVYLGYMVFDASSNVTLSGLQNVNGSVSVIGEGSKPDGLTSTSPCSPGLLGQPAMIPFNDNSEIAFVSDGAGTELQFILSKDKSTSSTNKNTNSVRVGVCRRQ